VVRRLEDSLGATAPSGPAEARAGLPPSPVKRAARPR